MLRSGGTIRLLEHARSRRRAISTIQERSAPALGSRGRRLPLTTTCCGQSTTPDSRSWSSGGRAGFSSRSWPPDAARQNRRSIRVVPRSLGQPHAEDLDEASRGRVRPCTRTCPAGSGALAFHHGGLPATACHAEAAGSPSSDNGMAKEPCSPTTRAGYPCRPSAPLCKARVRAESTAPTATDRRVRAGFITAG